jgi:hypothetical protein
MSSHLITNMLHPLLLAAAALLASAVAGQSTSRTAPSLKSSPPKVTILIVADDAGFNEFGFQNATRGLLTPNLDALAAGGVRLTHYYTHPLCSPTRSAMMTGRYSHRLGLQSSVVYWDTPWGVPLNETFIPQALKSIDGFGHTAMFGKVRHRISMPAPFSSSPI